MLDVPSWLHVWNSFWDWVDDRAIVRRAFMVATFVLVVRTLEWSFHFAEMNPKDGIGTATILGAIWTPITGLLGFMFSRYAGSRSE